MELQDNHKWQIFHSHVSASKHQKTHLDEDFDQIMYEVPMSIVKAGTVERGSIPEFIRFYNAMLSGEPHGYFEVKNVKRMVPAAGIPQSIP